MIERWWWTGAALAWAILLATCRAGLADAASGDARIGEDRTGVLTVDGQRRTYLLHVPAHWGTAQRRPLVLVLHGDAGEAAQVARITGFSGKADEAGFLVAYPEGTGWMNQHPRSWNAGACCGYAAARQLDDVEYLRRLIDGLEARYPIDPKRVYVTGISNGGMMAYRVGCELSDRIAAIAPVAAALSVSSCAPASPVSVVIFHGTADTYIPYEGGIGRSVSTGRKDPAVSAAVSFWVRQNGCATDPHRQTHGIVRHDTYPGGREGSEVAVYTIEGGGHAWPGGKRGWLLGSRPTQALSATDAIWEFFDRHAKP